MIGRELGFLKIAVTNELYGRAAGTQSGIEQMPGGLRLGMMCCGGGDTAEQTDGSNPQEP